MIGKSKAGASWRAVMFVSWCSCVTVLGGCFSGQRFLSPNNPIQSSGILDEFESQATSGGFRELMTVYYESSDEVEKRASRDRIINGLTLLIDNEYEYFATRMLSVRAFTNTGLDTTAAGLSIAATLVPHTATSSLLSGLSAGVLGVRLSVDKEFFYEQSSPILVAQMNQDRETAYRSLSTGLSQDTTKYPLARAARDLGSYYQAGTLVNAFAQLSQRVSGSSTAPGLAAVPRLAVTRSEENDKLAFEVEFHNAALVGRDINIQAVAYGAASGGRPAPILENRMVGVKLDAEGKGTAAFEIAPAGGVTVERVEFTAPTSTAYVYEVPK